MRKNVSLLVTFFFKEFSKDWLLQRDKLVDEIRFRLNYFRFGRFGGSYFPKENQDIF